MSDSSTKPKAGPDVLKRCAQLVKLAQDNPEGEEARTAAVQAMALMKEHELCLVPKSELDRIQKVVGDAQLLAKKHEAELTQRLVIGAIGGVVLGKQFKL
jgi:hypothetical protein